jgi:hypothetical protein
MKNLPMWLALTLPLCACDDPSPPPPPIEASAAARPNPSIKPLGPEVRARNGGARADQATMKRLRAELCYYGGFGVIYARDAYWESLGKEAPSEKHLPSFGEYGEPSQQAKGASAPRVKRNVRLAFDRHVRACAVAARLVKGKWPELDAALESFAPQASSAMRALARATSYYARKEYTRDNFTGGKESHQQISDSLGAFHEQHSAYGKAFESWGRAAAPTGEESSREGIAKLSGAVVTRARAVTRALLSPTRDEEATSKSLAALSDALEKLEQAGPQASLLVRNANELIKNAEAAPKENLSSRDRYLVASQLTAVLEADNRIFTNSLRGTAQRSDPRKPRESRRPLSPTAKE